MPRHHLTLVWRHRGYRPPPDLSRPELRAAFDAGRASQANEEDLAVQMERWHELRQEGWRARSPSIEAAAAITRTLMRRRSWRAALGRT